jgi:hypothetical protein
LPLTRHVEGRGAMRERLSVLLMAAFLLFAVSACGGDVGDQGEGGGGEQAQKEQAKVRKLPNYGDIRPGRYATDEFDPAFSFEVAGKGWVLSGSEERTLVEMSQGVADRCSPSSSPSRSSTRKG